MKNKNQIIATLLSLVFILPAICFAAGLIPSDKAIADDGFGALATLINNIITWFLTISVSVAAITFSIAGAKILMNPSNPEEIKKAKGMFSKTVIGMLIVLGAWLVIHTIITALVPNSAGTNSAGTNGALRFLSN